MSIRFFMLVVLALFLSAVTGAEQTYVSWKLDHFSVSEPLGGLKGDPVRGRAVAADQKGGNCLACHRLPIPEEPFHGEIGPALQGVGSRLSEAEIRLRVINERMVNPDTIMPAFYLDPKEVNRPADDYWGKTILTAQQVEDVVAYLVTLK